jgi:hypothetical protein
VDPAALGSFLSGVASVISAAWYVRRVRKRAREDCDQRIADVERALREGMEIERERDARDPHDG